MKRPVGFSTSSSNSFIYSPYRNQTFLCHPVLMHLFRQESAGISLNPYVDSFRPDGELKLPEGLSFSSQELDYQLTKYRFLKRYGYFKVPKEISLNGRLLPARIESDLRRIKQVIFEATEECNLSCTYCTFSKFYLNKERGKRKFATADAIRALDYFLSKRDPGAGKLTISFYGGEPLKNIRFIREIVTYLQENYPDNTFSYNLTSNGLLLAKNADFLAAHNIEVSVSLDGDGQANSFRLLPNHKPSHSLVLRNLDLVKQHYPEYFERCISFLSVLHNRNTLSDTYHYIREKYGKTPLVSLISTTNVNGEYKEEFIETFLKGQQTDRPSPDTLHDLFMKHPNVKELSNTIEKYSGIVFRNHFQLITRQNGNAGSKEYVPTSTCMPFSLRVFVAADGTVLPCEHISRVFEIGCLIDHELTIDNESIAGLYNRCFDKIRPFCNRCFLADNCMECVFNTGVESGDPRCTWFLDENGFASHLSKSFSLIESDPLLYSRILNEAYHE